MVEIDLEYQLEDVESEFKAVPSGQYVAKLAAPEDFTLGESSTRKAMITAWWTIQEGEHEGRRIPDNIVLSVGWKVKQYCVAAGIESGTALDTEDFIGLEAIVQVIEDEYQGKPTNKIKNIQPAS